MIIRTEQISALQNLKNEEFLERMVFHLREMYPDRTGLNDDAQLRAICDEEIEIARENYDIRTEYDLARFMEYRIYLGPDFDLIDWIYAILISLESSKIKMNKLDEGFSPG
jgi:hypothetical protein